jgi:glycosyltransferase involved in cell wall biosynthesis
MGVVTERNRKEYYRMSFSCVSIGMPVFNGERYVADAIESILKQDFGDFELIISDNASTDRTEAICRELAAADPRIRYFRNPRNLGAAANYNLCFERARGIYFKWAAHDDRLAPGYLRRAVAALEAEPEAVLCMVGVAEIDATDAVLRTYANDFPGIDAASPARRFAAVIHTRHQCEDFFGLFRRAALVGSDLHGAYNGSDRVLLAEMALRGPWVRIQDPLFVHREHDDRYTRAILLKDRKLAALWQDPDRPTGAASRLFHSLVYWNYARLIRKNIRSPAVRVACYAELLRWWFTDDHLIDVARDVVKRFPALEARIRALKLRLLGTAEARPGSLPRLK